MLKRRIAEERGSNGQRQYISHYRIIINVFCNNIIFAIFVRSRKYIIITGVNTYINDVRAFSVAYRYINFEVDAQVTFNFQCVI